MRSPPGPSSTTRRRMVLVPMSMVATRTRRALLRRHRAPVDRRAGAAVHDVLVAGAVGIGEVDAGPTLSVRREGEHAAIRRPGGLLVVALVLRDARQLPG